MPKSAKGLRAYELSGLLFRRRCPCLHLKSPPNSSHAEFGLQTPVKQVILHAGGSNHPKSRKAIVTVTVIIQFRQSIDVFQSPQKPKGDCDYCTICNTTMHYLSSNHPKSRKAIVTFSQL